MKDDQQIADLEIRIAYLEDSVDTLDAVVTKQAAEIRRLEKTNTEILKRLQHVNEVLEQVSLPSAPEPPPPHY